MLRSMLGLEAAFLHEGLLIFPSLSQTEEDGFVRMYRSGTRIAGILNAIRFPEAEATKNYQPY